MLRAFIAILLSATAAAGLSYAYHRQDRSYSELFDQASDEVRRKIVALRDAPNGWRLPKVEIDAIVDGIRRVYSKARGLVESDSYTYVTAPVERGRIETVVRATGTVNPTIQLTSVRNFQVEWLKYS